MNFDFTPAHLHLALNHIPIIGLAFASLPIVIGILAQSRTTIAAGLLATLLCAGAMPTIMQTGKEASHSFKEGKALPPFDDAGKTALHIHDNRADKTAPVIYACGLLALFALLALVKFSQAALWLSGAVLLGNIISILLSIWTAEAGGRIRHLEFRPPTPWDIPATTAAPAPAPASATTPSSMSTASPAEPSTSITPPTNNLPSASAVSIPSTSTTPQATTPR